MTLRLLEWAIALNLITALVLLIFGDVKNAVLGLFGSALFGLALVMKEGVDG